MKINVIHISFISTYLNLFNIVISTQKISFFIIFKIRYTEYFIMFMPEFVYGDKLNKKVLNYFAIFSNIIEILIKILTRIITRSSLACLCPPTVHVFITPTLTMCCHFSLSYDCRCHVYSMQSTI